MSAELRTPTSLFVHGFLTINGQKMSKSRGTFIKARQYLNHPVLGARLLECSEIILGVKDRSIADIFGYPDDRKLQSSMTLFSCVANPGSVFDAVLDQCFHGKRDTRTLELLGRL